MFDSLKTDISDEFKTVIENLYPYEEKVVCILNKADDERMDTDSLIKVYGSLLWSLARVFKKPEVHHVHICSFKENADEGYMRNDHRELIDKDSEAIRVRLDLLPRDCAGRKLNDLLKRITSLRSTIAVLYQLKLMMPWLWGHANRQKYLIENLEEVYAEAQAKNSSIPPGDYTPVEEMKKKLRESQLNFKTAFSFSRRDYEKAQTKLNDILDNEKGRIATYIEQVFTSGNETLEYNNGRGRRESDTKDVVARLIRDAWYEDEQEENMNNAVTDSGRPKKQNATSFRVKTLLCCLLALFCGVYMASKEDKHQAAIAFKTFIFALLNLP